MHTSTNVVWSVAWCPWKTHTEIFFFFFCPSIFFLLSALLFIGRGNVWCGETWSLVDVALKVVFLPGSPEVHQCTWVLVWGESEPWTGTMRAGVGRAGVGIKRRENMIHGRVSPSRETAADLQSEDHWTGTKALFRQKECSMSCDGWRRSVREPLSRCVSGSHLQANTLNRDQMADARGPSGTCALRHTNDYGCRPINGHICKGEQQPAHWEWVSSFLSPLEWRHAGVRAGIKNSSGNAAFSSSPCADRDLIWSPPNMMRCCGPLKKRTKAFCTELKK